MFPPGPSNLQITQTVHLYYCKCRVNLRSMKRCRSCERQKVRLTAIVGTINFSVTFTSIYEHSSFAKTILPTRALATAWSTTFSWDPCLALPP